VNSASTAIIIAVLGPLVTGLVTAAGIALERRRNERDLEALRLRLVEMARNQIAAVQPLWSSMENNEVSTPADTRERAYTIIISALDAILRAQAMSQPEDHLQRQVAKAEEQNRGSILSDLLLRRHFQTRGARVLRVLYYLTIRLEWPSAFRDSWVCSCSP
jgi:hypothetical protein